MGSTRVEASQRLGSVRPTYRTPPERSRLAPRTQEDLATVEQDAQASHFAPKRGRRNAQHVGGSLGTSADVAPRGLDRFPLGAAAPPGRRATGGARLFLALARHDVVDLDVPSAGQRDRLLD